MTTQETPMSHAADARPLSASPFTRTKPQLSEQLREVDRAIADEDNAKAAASAPARSADYAPLGEVITEAFKQASQGKGYERHGQGKDFLDQPIMAIGRMVGPGYNTGQAMKKAQEAKSMTDRGEVDAAVAELLGVIVYAASAVLVIRGR